MPQINPIQTGGGIVFSSPADLITTALQDIGVVGFGQAPTTGEINAALKVLNAMLDFWGALRENINVRRTRSFSFVIGQGVYGIGQGSADFDTVRPIKIEQAYYRDNQNTDFQLDCSMSQEYYSAIPIKNISGNPTKLLYVPDSPFGTIYFDYAPSVAWTLYMNNWEPLSKIIDPNDVSALSYPDGYESAILYNLETLLCAPNKKSVPPKIEEMAKLSLQAIQAAYGETPVVIKWDTPNAGKVRRSSFFDMGSNNA